jgi:hypothetical protein
VAGDIPVEQAETLRTIAEVATAFAGFSGVVVVLGNRANREWSLEDTITISLLLLCSLGVVFFALAPLLVEAAGVPVWRISNGLFGIYHLGVCVWGTSRSLRVDEPLLPRWVIPAAATGALVIVAFNFVVAVGLLQPLSFFAYLAGLLWILGMATMMFGALLFESRRGVS